MNTEDKIEIYCPTCEHNNLIDFDKTFTDHTIRCEKCNIDIFWQNCPKCETGWYDLQKKPEDCPGCNSIEPPSATKSSNFRLYLCFTVVAIITILIAPLITWLA